MRIDVIVGHKILFLKNFRSVCLYLRYCVAAVRIPRMTATKMITRLYENTASSPIVKLLPNILLITGSEVAIMINKELRKNINEPINIQNSREEVCSSFTMWGMSR